MLLSRGKDPLPGASLPVRYYVAAITQDDKSLWYWLESQSNGKGAVRESDILFVPVDLVVRDEPRVPAAEGSERDAGLGARDSGHDADSSRESHPARRPIRPPHRPRRSLSTPRPAESAPPPDPAVPDDSFEPAVGQWIVLQPGALIRSGNGKSQVLGASIPQSYQINVVQTVGSTKWYWITGSANGWVRRDEMLAPTEAYQQVSGLIEFALDQTPSVRPNPELYLLRGILALGQPWAGAQPIREGLGADLAIADLTDFLRRRPADPRGYFFRARALEERLIPRDMPALADLTEAIRLDKRFLPAYYDRAQVYEILAISLWRQEATEQNKALSAAPVGIPGDPRVSAEGVPSGRVLAFYRLAHADLLTIVLADPYYADARVRLKTRAMRMTVVEELANGGTLLPAGTVAESYAAPSDVGRAVGAGLRCSIRYGVRTAD